MLITAINHHSPLSSSLNPTAAAATPTPTTNLLFSSSIKPLLTTRPSTSSSSSSSSLTTVNNHNKDTSLQNPNTLHHVTHPLRDETNEDPEKGGADQMVSSASAVVSAIQKMSSSPVEFVQKIEKDHNKKTKLVLPSSDFQRLCVEQLDLFRRIIDPEAILSVYVRPAGSYVMDRLELRRVSSYPGVNAADTVILVGNFNVPTGLRAAEAALSSHQLEFVQEHRAIVFPMVKHPFVVGFLVAELPIMEMEKTGTNGQSEGRDLMNLPSPEEAYDWPSGANKKSKSWSISLNDESMRIRNFTAEKRLNAINISRTLAMAYVMDQKALVLQQSSWQNNVRMNNLVEQIRGPLSSIRTLSKMLSIHMKRSEIAYDIVEDIMVQGDRMRDNLQELQDAVYLTKANIVRYNEETLKKIHNSAYAHMEPMRSQLARDNFPKATSSKLQNSGKPRSLTPAPKDLEMPMPPLALAPLQQHGIRPCSVSEVLSDLVEAVRPLAHKQQRIVEFSELSQSLQVAVEEPALRQALSNVIEGALLRTQVGGKVEIVSIGAPAGGILIVIDDDGPDMHYMTQMHALTPFGAELFSENMVEDNMTWNFVAGLTVAREILENYGCIVRFISPRISDAALGAGGTRIELWLPSFAALSDPSGLANEE